MGRFDELIGPLRAKFEAVVPHLNERQRRLLYGAEARHLGHGGIAAVASAAGVSKGCVSRGMADLEQGGEPVGRVRRTGGGRPAAADKDPGLRTALLDLVDDSTQGGITRQALDRLVAELRDMIDAIPPEQRPRHRKLAVENIIWATVLDQRGLPASLLAHLFHIGENQMRTLIQQAHPLLQRHGHHSEPLPVRLIDPAELARYVMNATSSTS